MTAAQGRLRHLLADRSPAAREVVLWPGDMRLEVAAYLGKADLPDDLVVSVRCLVTVGDQVLVCQDAAPSVHVLPGGRREQGESWRDTAQREVREETGWRVELDDLQMLGFIHLRHLTAVPDGHPFPHPDFLQVVLCGEGTGSPVDWVDSDGWVQRSWPAAVEEARSLPLPATHLAFLGCLGSRSSSAAS